MMNGSTTAPHETAEAVEQKVGETMQTGATGAEGKIAGTTSDAIRRVLTNGEELEKAASAAMKSVLDQELIMWFDMKRFEQVKEFLLRTSKQRGWEERQLGEAAQAVLMKLNDTGDLRTSEKTNRIYRIMEKAVENIY